MEVKEQHRQVPLIGQPERGHGVYVERVGSTHLRFGAPYDTVTSLGEIELSLVKFLLLAGFDLDEVSFLIEQEKFKVF